MWQISVMTGVVMLCLGTSSDSTRSVGKTVRFPFSRAAAAHDIQFNEETRQITKVSELSHFPLLAISIISSSPSPLSLSHLQAGDHEQLCGLRPAVWQHQSGVRTAAANVRTGTLTLNLCAWDWGMVSLDDHRAHHTHVGLEHDECYDMCRSHTNTLSAVCWWQSPVEPSHLTYR